MSERDSPGSGSSVSVSSGIDNDSSISSSSSVTKTSSDCCSDDLAVGGKLGVSIEISCIETSELLGDSEHVSRRATSILSRIGQVVQFTIGLAISNDNDNDNINNSSST